MPFRFSTQAKCHRECHGKQEDDENFDGIALFREEQYNHGRYEEHNGQDGDDQTREDINSLLRV